MKNKRLIVVLTVVLITNILRYPFIVADSGIDLGEVLGKDSSSIEVVEKNKDKKKCDLRLLCQRMDGLICRVKAFAGERLSSNKGLKYLGKVEFVIRKLEGISEEDLLRIQAKIDPKDLKRLFKIVSSLERLVSITLDGGFGAVVDVCALDLDVSVKGFTEFFSSDKAKATANVVRIVGAVLGFVGSMLLTVLI